MQRWAGLTTLAFSLFTGVFTILGSGHSCSEGFLGDGVGLARTRESPGCQRRRTMGSPFFPGVYGCLLVQKCAQWVIGVFFTWESQSNKHCLIMSTVEIG